MAAVVRPGSAAGQRRHRGRAHRPRAIKARSARARRRPGVVMAAFSAIAAILAVVVFAAVLWPLWRESRGVVFGAVVVLVLARSEVHTSELQSLMRISYAVFCMKQKKS